MILALDIHTKHIEIIVYSEKIMYTMIDIYGNLHEAASCLEDILDNLSKIYCKPKIVLFEKMFLGKNTKTLQQLSEVVGVMKAVLIKHNLPFYEIHPSSWKAALGERHKKKIALKINSLYRYDPPSEHFASCMGLIHFYLIKDKLC